MNPSQFTNLRLGLAVGGILVLIYRDIEARLRARREQAAAAVSDAARAGFLRGLTHGYATWGALVKALNSMDVHGFAEACRECGTVTGSIIASGEEYWKCGSCDHRNPAPMPYAPKRPPQEPANHEQ